MSQSPWAAEEVMSADNVREIAATDLIPAGSYEGQLLPLSDESFREVVTENRTHPLEGKTIVRLHVVLFTDAGDRHLFVDAYPGTVKATSKKGNEYIRPESRIASMLYKATGMFGQDFLQVCEFAAQNRLTYKITVSKEKTDAETGKVYEAQNRIAAIAPASA
ncbi:MAG: hypothetical protein ACRCZI_00230 [Cetobacterium sp.]